jgi:hypothetical protein
LLSPDFKEGLVKALWSIRNLSKNTQRIYSKNLRRIAINSDLNENQGLKR